ncbi:MAG: right-handed parallel beta-helix repeat-containing protein [Alphaproteobacteria bacterium]|nr:right-handed parallel beta-helix repeat-containing protein [Alphaproteobacteria bacterium]
MKPTVSVWQRLNLSVALLAGFCVAAEAGDNGNSINPAAEKWRGWLEFGGIFGTDRTSRGEVSVFAPIAQTPDSLFFLDLKGNYFEQNTQEGNFALGYRRMLDNGFNLGAWLGTDVRSTSLDNTFWQFSGGVEALSHNYDFRANFYLPLTESKAGGGDLTQFALQGNNIFMTGGREVPLGGVDAEAGFRVPLEEFNTTFSAAELRAYGGGYYFDDNEALQPVAGGKARLELRIPDVFEALPGSQLTAGYQFTYDDTRKARHQAGLKLRIPFGGNPDADSDWSDIPALSPQERRMIDGLERDTDIVTTASARENVIDDSTNVALHRVAYASDEASLHAATGQGANTLIIVQGAGAPIDMIAPPPTVGPPAIAPSTVNLQARQTMQGGGSTIRLRGARSGTVAGFTAPGARPTLTSTTGGFSSGVVALASHTHVAGLNIRGGEAGVIGLSSIHNVVIEQNDIQFAEFSAIAFPWDRNRDIKILNNTLSKSGAGVDFSFENENLIIAGNTITDVGFAGIHVWQDNNNVQILDNTIGRVQFRGIFGSYGNTNVTISGNRIFDSGRDAIWLSGWQNGRPIKPGQHVISGNTITGFRVNGIALFENHDNVLISGNTIEGLANSPLEGLDAGIFIDNGNNNIHVAGNTIRGVAGDAVRLGDPNRPSVLHLPNTNVLLADNTLSGIGGDAFRFTAAGHTLLGGSSGNQLLDIQGGLVCSQTVPNSFSGSFSVLDPTALQTFIAGCN